MAPLSEPVVFYASVYSPERGRQIAKVTSDGETSTHEWLTEGKYNAYKPITSQDGKKIAYFICTNEMDKETGDVSVWKSKICVMNKDGSDQRELTDDVFFNGNLHWTRDGTNRITWFRIFNATGKPMDLTTVKTWRTTTDATPGDEEMLSDPNDPEYFREYGHSHLKDGRMFILRGSKRHFLMRPDPVGSPTYEPISYENDPMHLHKICISHDETKISYMKQTMEDLPKDEYMGGFVCVADFDANGPNGPTITNEVELHEQNYKRIIWYSSFSPDDKQILYTDNGTVLLYDIATRESVKVSTDDTLEYRYPNFDDSVK